MLFMQCACYSFLCSGETDRKCVYAIKKCIEEMVFPSNRGSNVKLMLVINDNVF